MNQDLYDRIEDYLDGALDNEAARHFEHDLLQEEVASKFREALLMRDLLGSLPPDQPPEGLIERIESALVGTRRTSETETATYADRSSGALIAAFKAGLRWPGYMVAGLSGGSSGLKRSISGVRTILSGGSSGLKRSISGAGTIGYSLGPFQEPARKRMQALRLKRKPLWKIALSRMWQGVSA
jgi:hypothetical protein